jgi:DNA polymerase-3 subunit epsilon
MDFTALDFETTGVDPRQDRIVAFYVARYDEHLVLLDESYQLVNPGTPIPEAATAVHGVTDDEVEDLPGFEAHADTLRDQVLYAPVIGYNVQFDLDVLHHELVCVGLPGIPIDHPVVDPFKVFLDEVPRTLTGAVQHYCGLPMLDAHHPKADVQATIRVLQAQMGRKGVHNPLEVMPVDVDSKHVDRSRLFKRRRDGIVVFGFGKHRGKPITGFPEYLEWMLKQDFPDEAKRIARGALGQVYA